MAVLTPDPKIITAGEALCSSCDAELPSADDVTCAHCGHTGTPPRPRRLTQYSQRCQRGEKLFEKDREDAVITVAPVPALILSHSCDIDCKQAIRVAPVYPLTEFKKEPDREKIRTATGHMSHFYLAVSDRIPECMANLDQAFHVETRTLGDQKPFPSTKEGRPIMALVPFVEVIEDRLASLDGKRISDLYERLTWLMVRPDDDSVVRFELSASVFYDDPDRPGADKRPGRGWKWPVPQWVRAYKPDFH